jgi:hypothetical protein
MPGPHVNSAFKTVKSHKTLINRRIVTIFLFKDEQTGLHIFAKRICDWSSSFKIIHQKACRSYGEQDSSTQYLVLLSSSIATDNLLMNNKPNPNYLTDHKFVLQIYVN